MGRNATLGAKGWSLLEGRLLELGFEPLLPDASPTLAVCLSCQTRLTPIAFRGRDASGSPVELRYFVCSGACDFWILLSAEEVSSA